MVKWTLLIKVLGPVESSIGYKAILIVNALATAYHGFVRVSPDWLIAIVPFDIPLNLILLYASSFALLAGWLTAQLFCPEHIRRYKSREAYSKYVVENHEILQKAAEQHLQVIRETIEATLHSVHRKNLTKQEIDIMIDACLEEIKSIAPFELQASILELHEMLVKWNCSDIQSSHARLVTLILLCIAALLAGYVMLLVPFIRVVQYL